MKDIKEVNNEADYSIEYRQKNLMQIRKLETQLYEFRYFKIDYSIPQDIRISSGKKLYDYCKSNSIVLSTDDMDYDRPIISLLEESSFKIKYIKVIYEKDLREHQFQYDDIFEYKSLADIGLDKFMKVFEKTSDVGIEKDVEPRDYFSIIYEYAGDKYNPKNYIVAMYNDKEIGVMMPQVFPHNNKEGTIFHLGVVPEERNKGYGRVMHSKSLEILKNQGVEKYIGSTNAENKPMLRLFELNGCKEWFKRFFYYAV